MKSVNLYFLLLCLLPFSLLAQGSKLTGVVINSSGAPITGAYIVHFQSDRHAHSNELGQFHLDETQVGDTLQVLHLGYESQLVFVNSMEEKIIIELQEATFQLDEVVVQQNIRSTNIIAAIDLQTATVNSSQEVLRTVPGLFIGQHAGGGKAEQIFLRGFDIDHGTDVSISVDGMPVNMVSHAHGQGYADLHFLIPETIDFVNYEKGPYNSEIGNFATAGSVNFKTKESLDRSTVSVGVGRFNTIRATGLFNLLSSKNHNAYIATQHLTSDGPFESPQNFERFNIMGKYTAKFNNHDHLSLSASSFSSTWDASGQIPERAVQAGLISRFGSIDDTEGGTTSRTDFQINFKKGIDDQTFIKNRAYFSLYDFELYSNFTFFLNDPVNGDQIRQKEDRRLFGFESEWNHSFSLGDYSTLLQVGAGFRNDDIRGNELSRTLNRKTVLSRIQLGDVNEKNLYAYANAEFDIGDWIFQPGLRVDYFRFNYTNQLDSLYSSPLEDKAVVSPKMNIIYNLRKNIQLFFKSGIGFHSNDSRVVLGQTTSNILPLAYGCDLGAIFKPSRKIIVNFALWHLMLQQEFVYVGDEGIVEPSGRSRRLGVDLSMRYQINDWLFANTDLTYAKARSLDEPETANYIPLAPIFTATGGVNIQHQNFSSKLHFRYLADRPANEDNSIVANGYFITDLNFSYHWSKLELGFAIENLFNQSWNETQFATESRLQSEPRSVEEIHFTPGTPFFFKGILKYKF